MLAINIAAGFALDLILGDPYQFPHPVKLIGRCVTLLEKFLRKLREETIAGILLLIIIASFTYAVTLYISSISIVIEIILIYTVFATKSLATEAKKVYSYLEENNLDKARELIGLLVSRDTKDLLEKDIIKATVETVSENLVDGIISPMFFLFIGGAPLAMTYKAINTLDSMVGYKNEKYIRFGWASAKMDDLLNYIPARITAFLLIPLSALICRLNVKNTIHILLRDRFNHDSPNSAHSEAAVAGALECQLGGPASYFGKIVSKPAIGDNLREIEKEDILKSVRLMYVSSVIGLCVGALILLQI